MDAMALGEVMLRLDPGENRICRADQFRTWEGGGEYNVIQALSNCFGHRTAMLTSLVDNEVGKLLSGLIQRSGVSTNWIRWLPHDGIGRAARNGLYFLERGFGERGARAVMDRANTAIAQLQPQDLDWDAIFAEAQPRWFHVGGVMAGLSTQSPAVVKTAIKAARNRGAVVSYDLNYRASLWQERGGKAAAIACNNELLPWVDVVFGVESLPHAVEDLDEAVFAQALENLQAQFPNIRLAATTMRIVRDASHNDWSGMCLAEGQIHTSRHRLKVPILDRVGGGDAFAAGLIHGVLTDTPLPQALEWAAAHGALVMSTPGDNSTFGKEDVYAYAEGADARVSR